ncbi:MULTISPECIES: mechanosensitive ion channel family protein [Sutcliffiella]|uniref:Mechanosensing system component YbdG n=1 Tax=Sutcliffiella cohnii TaxID=33932 RepID=A0A223KN49_9BACI|nr:MULTISPECIES: mechanosensitive ion channel domain-containing protein [Sutcliffiella]AST90911.1 mechanosensitive ion channel protein MscS [Sutcliffiella cohnii]MED4017794.1 mechanosensitive ion channel [Sutcliffiella cohnii]WBL16698.1 mechanosensitive ion channel [Sutcliffiella sp. NC1]
MEFIDKKLLSYGMDPTIAEYLTMIIMILFIALISVIANFITKKIIIRVITHFVTNNKFTWDDMLLERKVFHRISHVVPAIIIYFFASAFSDYETVIQKLAVTYIIIVALVVIISLFNALNDIYQTFEISKTRPIKGYIQVANIVIVILGVILVISNLIGQSPLILLSGIGALSAVLLLVFRDSLLGLVAGIQLTSNDMVRVGDWIEMPKYEADGDIIDISLNTVKVQNWDKTITTIPSYALISDSFKNWRGMQNAGGRRIKRSIFIDTGSIAFCDEPMIEKFKHIHYLSEYIEQKEKEIEEYNIKNEINRNNRVNGRALTNIGVFRAYINNYLKNHPGIEQNMTMIVRQLAPSEFGLPIEIYAFTNDIQWNNYESIQSDIFDHLLAVAPEFGLRIFQNPSGSDLKGIFMDTGTGPLSTQFLPNRD